MQEHTVNIEDIEELLKTNPNLEIDTPDGWVRVIDFIVKPFKKCFQIQLENGKQCGSAERHLFQKSDNSWVLTKDLKVGDELITDEGNSKIILIKPLRSQDVYDITVDHINHRYFSNGICSHNTRRFSNSSGTGEDRLVLSGQKLDLLSYYNGNGKAGLNGQGLPSTSYSYIKKSENDVGEVKRIVRIKDKQFNNWFRRKKKILKEMLNFNLKTKFSQKK